VQVHMEDLLARGHAVREEEVHALAGDGAVPQRPGQPLGCREYAHPGVFGELLQAGGMVPGHDQKVARGSSA